MVTADKGLTGETVLDEEEEEAEGEEDREEEDSALRAEIYHERRGKN